MKMSMFIKHAQCWQEETLEVLIISDVLTANIASKINRLCPCRNAYVHEMFFANISFV